ncbi:MULTISPECIES: glycosyltransferase family 2 protein [unclassified Breznakia]|uniref:glycosyltransferase family 2 protein n=1 Tax=unclassified Breznakia TaxID=2623764 RepID=UPI002475454B|nr:MULTISPECIES: glycosyltransferase family 2 protein [unclassified Breznakia]MDH6367834.1 cellulose synthase (UDP-forming) [Breznakia sp. PH1-1]MDH6404919.1 cellulose synthase (UDP-forming) [Breznakia sp. PF1-11]MDH6412637.1 cellulose synthase (UDP-forming) [Breznakia sp. PFB1-11]MDH6414994.1 cellulose synthase (UDP-forming) [Breznakia sp. PFB1-14]MDH6417305.1 cellulose synthase (UDP-forming) [Breznakia sp. PFB1-4]
MNRKKDKKDVTETLINRKVTMYVVFILAFVYISWRLIFTIPFKFGIVSVVLGIILWFSEAITVVETFTHMLNVHNVKIPEMPEIPEDMYPDVDFMIATHNESLDLLYKTLNGCKHLKYPDKSKVHIYLCDDGNRAEVAQLAKDMQVGYFGFDGNKHAKAGNLNYALPKTHSPLIAIFDADMIPTSDFLIETVPYFFQDKMIKDKNTNKWRLRTADEKYKGKKLGYVQTKQAFYNADVLQTNLYSEDTQPNEQEYFYHSVNVARINTESSAFAGSNTVFDREILEEVGGFATHSITEDFATSIDILGKGYRSIAVPKELAHGLSPDTVDDFIKQRKRWSRGAAQGIMTKKFWFGKMSLKQKWNFFLAYSYWWTFVRRLVFILCPILYGLFGIHVADTTFESLMIMWLPYFIIYNYGLKKMSNGTISAVLSDRQDTIQFPYLMGSIIKGTLMIPQKKFVVTNKTKASGRNSRFILALPHIILAILSVITIFICIRQVILYKSTGPLIIIFWASYNLFALLAAIVYYFGRVITEKYEQFPIKIHTSTTLGDVKLDLISETLAEDKIVIKEKAAIQFKDNQSNIVFNVKDNGYETNVEVKYLDEYYENDDICYVFEIAKVEDINEYLQILYDRPHFYPREVNVHLFKDLRKMYVAIRNEFDAE